MQKTNPSQRNLKHMIDRQTFFVYGRILDEEKLYSEQSFAVAAYSNRYTRNELVDSTHVARVGTHYGLNLPEGQYDLLVLADQDQNGTYSQSEVVGRHQIIIEVATYPERVVNSVDLRLSEMEPAGWIINIPVPEIAQLQESLFFPKGTIRSLDDPLFGSDMAALGMYEPAAFVEQAPTMFYALEEDFYKVPVVFVHGIGGSAREFAAIVDQLDRQRYKPWFFYYPSGGDLAQLGKLFYDIFLSGTVISLSDMPVVIVAHSMGGLVVREALNKYRGAKRESRLELFITIASPMGGHPAAAVAVKRSPLVLPSWRALSPDSRFINRLYRNPLPPQVRYQLLYTYGNPGSLKLGENSDGVVPLSSQLHAAAQRESTEQFGFNSSHTGVLKDENAIRYVIESIEQVKSPRPEPHIKVIIAGGYDVILDDSYSEKDRYYIRTIGKYLFSIANGTLDSIGHPDLEHFVAVSKGRAKARTEIERLWLKFVEDYPDFGD